ncbi:MAG: ExbD/TolR family protein [Planctomycetota bacterium]
MPLGKRRLKRATFLMPATVAMIDVIFILFAFFLWVSQIRKSTVKVNLPEVSDAVATGEREDDSKPMRYLILLTEDGQFGLGREMFYSREAFFAHFREVIARDKASGRPIVAEIVLDRQAPSGDNVDLINFLTRQGVKRLEFLAVERGPTGGR